MPIKRESTPATSSGPATPSPPVKKVKKSGSASPDKPRQVKNAWTPEEDTIFIELVKKTLMEGLYPVIKQDGRLARESPAVRAHLIALMNRLGKSA
ncbi:hypothetical protein IAU60_004130 [Kwoniella sp. DSM 27419]